MEQIQLTLSTLHLIFLILTVIIGIGIQVGIYLRWKNEIEIKQKEFDIRIKALEKAEKNESRILSRIEFNLKRLFDMQKQKYIDIE